MTSKPTNATVAPIFDIDQDELELALQDAKLLPPHQYKLAKAMCYITLITILISALMTIYMAWVSSISWAVCLVILAGMSLVASQVWREQFN